MVDIEKVIKGIHCHLSHDCRPNKCPYANDDACTSNVFLDAVELLKEQQETIETQRDIISTQEEQIADLQKEQMNKGYSGYDGSFIL